MRKIFLFGFLWLMVGFSTGTSTLMGPVRWITAHGRQAGWPDDLENALVLSVIVVYVTGSALVARWLTRAVLTARRQHVRFGLPCLVFLAAAGALWLWLTPEVMGGSVPEESRTGSAFTFGPYPSEERLAGLKREGYTAVVSLLHPAVVPFETRLIEEGKAAAERAGLEYLHFPMLPWVSDNAEALGAIGDLARGRQGRYYVHCYLGQDRVRLVKRVVEEAEPTAEIVLLAEESHLGHGRMLERGEVVEVTDGVYLTPYPTDDEFMSYILPGTHGPVVSLLDPDNPGDLPWIEKERKLLETNHFPFTLLPLSHGRYSPEAAQAAARRVAEMPRPVVVHAFLSAASGRAPTAEAFLQAFRSGLAPLPPSLFKPPMGGETVEVIAPNVAAGPRPAKKDLTRYLRPRGIRQVVYLGTPDPLEAAEDRLASEAAGLGWRWVESVDAEFLEMLAAGGPWYLYGPSLVGEADRIFGSLGPAIPESMRWDPADSAEREVAASSPIPFLKRIKPDLKSLILTAPPLLLLTVLAAGFAAWLRSARKVRAPYTRKIFHFIIFTSAGLLHLAGGLSLVALFGTLVALSVLYAVYRGDGFGFYEAMARPTDSPNQTLFILIPLVMTAIGGLVSNLFFGAFAFVGYLVAGWGDAAGEPVGVRWGRRRYRVPSMAGVFATRSLEGSTAVWLVGGLAAFLGLYLNGVPVPVALTAALACGTVGAVVEAFSNHGLDNLTIQIAASGTAFLFLS